MNNQLDKINSLEYDDKSDLSEKINGEMTIKEYHAYLERKKKNQELARAL